MAFARKNTGLFKKKRVTREEAIVVTAGGNSDFDESYNRLKDNLIYYSSDGGHKVIQIESSIAGEGKTTLTCNLGVSLAFNNKKVCIVDLDFRKARVHRPFKVSSECGIGDFMAGEATKEQIIKHTEYGVDIITRGKAIYNASLVLTSEKIIELIGSLKEEYDFVLLDCPPVLIISDYINIARLSDGILFIVAAGYTKKSAVKDAYALLAKTGTKVIGSVMTLAQKSMKGYYNYYGKYGKHYGYGYGYYHRHGGYGDNHYGDPVEEEKPGEERSGN